jgi:hypothetical protein
VSDQFDEKLAESFVGKHLLVGMTYVDPTSEPIEQKQLHGTILRINPVEGVVIALHGSGEELSLPPDFRSFQAAPPGEYRLRATGEVVLNPDLLCNWVVEKPTH